MSLDSGVSPASSSWRKAISLRGIREGGGQVKTATLPSTDWQIQDASCLALHDGLNFAVHGSFSRENPEFQVVRVMQTSTQEGIDFTVNVRCSLPGPAYSASYVGSRVIFASDNGNVHSYSLDPTTLTSSSGPYSTPYSKDLRKVDIPVQTYSHNKLKSTALPTPSPDQWGFTHRINRVAINPHSQNLFLSLENHRTHVWDFERTSEPVYSGKGSNGPLFAGSWNPHKPDEFIISGATHTIKLLDYRMLSNGSKKSLVWKKTEGHHDCIRDVKWSPLIPYWIASAGNDGAINIWDIRFDTQPVLSLQGHSSAVLGLSWSRTHADMLASCSADQEVKLWSLRAQPHHVIASSGSTFGDAVVGVEFSNFKPLQLHALSSSGEFSVLSLSPKWMEMLAIPRAINPDPEEKEVEKLVYIRILAKAFEKVLNLASKYRQEGQIDRAVEMLELCVPRNLDQYAPPSDTRTSADVRALFFKELEDFSYFIPPNFPAHLAQQKVPPTIQKQIDDAFFNLKILRSIQRSEASEIKALEKTIYESLEKDINKIEQGTLKKILELYLKSDFAGGIEMALRIADIFDRKDAAASFEPLARFVLTPTVYEVSNNAALRDNSDKVLRKLLGNMNVTKAQLWLHKSVVMSASKEDWNAVTSAVESFLSNEGAIQDIVSVQVVKAYLTSLLKSERFDQYTWAALSLAETWHGHDIAQTLSDALETECYPLLTKYIAPWTAVTSPENADLQKYAQVVTRSLLLLLNAPYLPDYMADRFPELVEKMTSNFVFVLNRLFMKKRGTEAKQLCQKVFSQLENAPTDNTTITSKVGQDASIHIRTARDALQDFLEDHRGD